MPRKPTQERIIQGAIRFIAGNLPEKLTLEEVAREAGLTRSGILYHFNTKKGLVEAVIMRLMDELEAAIVSGYQTFVYQPYPWLRAYWHAFKDREDFCREKHDGLIYLSVYPEPGKLKAVSNMRSILRARLASEIDDTGVLALFCVLFESLFWNRSLGLNIRNDELLGILEANMSARIPLSFENRRNGEDPARRNELRELDQKESAAESQRDNQPRIRNGFPGP